MLNLLKLFFEMLKVGAFSFGGGYAMLPLLKETSLSLGYITVSEFSSMLSISQITPGPMSINLATYIGVKSGYCFGALASTIGMIFIPMILVLLVSSFLEKFKKNIYIISILNNLKPVLLALVFYSFVSLSDIYKEFIYIPIGFIAFFLIRRLKVKPLYVLILGGILGLLFF